MLFVGLDYVRTIGQVFDDLEFLQKVLLCLLIRNFDDFDSKQFLLIGPTGNLIDFGEFSFSKRSEVHGVLVLISSFFIAESDNFKLL